MKITLAELGTMIDRTVKDAVAKHGGPAPANGGDGGGTTVADPPARTTPQKEVPGAEKPARTNNLPAVHTEIEGEPKRGDAADARLELGLGGRYRYAPRYRAAERGFTGPRFLVREYGAGDKAIVDAVCKLHLSLFRGDRSGALEILGQFNKSRALSEGIGSAGGFLVPDEFAQDVIMKMGELTPLATREFLRIIPMGSDVKKVPVIDTRPTVGRFEENTSGEGGTDPAVGEVELVARGFGRVLPISQDLIDDASVAILELLRDLYAEILGEKRNSLLTNGSGANEPEGIRQNANVATKAFSGTQTAAADVVTFVNGVYHTIKAQYRSAAIWLASNAMIETLSNIVDADGRPLLNTIMDEPFPRLKGRPVLENNDIPDNLGAGSNESELIFGNFRLYAFGDRQQMEVDTDTGGKYFEKRQVALRVFEKYDGRVGQAEAFVRGTGKTVA